MDTQLQQDLLAAGASRFFGASPYWDPTLIPLEQEYLFRQTWLYLGDRTTLLQSGNVLVTEVAGTSLLIVQDSDQPLRAFYNVCPHRASLLCSTPGSHQLNRLVCPYHGWVYNLEGQLLGTPREDRFCPSLQSSEFPLQPVRVAEWQGFVFVCLSPTAPPLLEYLGSIPTQMAGYRTHQTRRLVHKTYTVPCNWKVYHDNTLCDYHVAIAHRTTLSPIQGPIRHYEHTLEQYVNLLYSPTPESWRSHHTPLPHLPIQNQEGFFTYGIFPNLHLLALPDGVLAWIRIDPQTVDTCAITLEIYGIPGWSPEPDDLLREFEAFMVEDMEIAAGVQRGYTSGAYRPGPVNSLEVRIAHHQQLLRQFLLPGLHSGSQPVLANLQDCNGQVA